MESSIFDAIGIDPGIILIFVLGVLLIVLVYMIKISMKMSRFIKKYKMFMRGLDGASLERAFAARFNQMDLLEENSRNHMEEIRKIKEVQNITLNKVAIVKYDAFKEMGGKLSFALAMLDKENNGFVMNAIHSSDGCYTYVKEIVKGESYVVLGEEEKEALRQAVNSHNELEQ
ncbi:MAG: DUF4446 family protein [Blautia sp.]|nr:DUF4446 family protein [Blautia sp.]MDY2898630.1 DUF4446 family protein [Candidatus Limivivens sp.]